jgi:hypothetical protein
MQVTGAARLLRPAAVYLSHPILRGGCYLSLKPHFISPVERVKNAEPVMPINLSGWTPGSGRPHTQFSIFRLATRENSLVLLVTRIAPSARACAAIIMSNAPMGCPCRSRSDRI